MTRRNRALRGEELEEAVAEAAERLFSTPPPEDHREVTEADVERAAYTLFGGTAPAHLREEQS